MATFKADTKYSDMQDRFKKGLIPLPKTSNDYFYQAALVCKDELKLTYSDAVKKIKIVYTEWENHITFSKRPWSNIIVKVSEVYNEL